MPEARSDSGSPEVRKRYSPSSVPGLPSPRLPSTCSTWRATGSPELTIVTLRPSIRWSIGRISG